MKMMLAYILNTYDIEPVPERPKNIWVGSNILPPMAAKVRVRRKKTSGLGL